MKEKSHITVTIYLKKKYIYISFYHSPDLFRNGMLRMIKADERNVMHIFIFQYNIHALYKRILPQA